MVHQTALAIKRGGVIAYPTETIYGLGCDAFNQRAVERIFEIKGRPETKPVLVLVANRTMLSALIEDIPPIALTLMKEYWPGPLTLIFQARTDVHPLITAGSGKIGVRIPGNAFCLKLLKQSRTPIVSTSANISGKPVSSSVESLKKLFAEKVQLFIDAGELPQSLPSTLLDVSEGKVTLVREGAVGLRQLTRYL